MVEELHTLLERAHVKAPFVLVGHSLGGLNVRLYASTYRSEVSGMVLLDATTEDQAARAWALLPTETLRAFKSSLNDNKEGVDYDAFLASMEQVRSSTRSLENIPLVVLTRGKEGPAPPGVSPELDARMAKVWGELQSELPRLSSNSIQVIAENSQHYLQWEAPKLVIAAVQETVKSVRERRRLDAAALKPLAQLPRAATPGL
jgi:pimeloyl-ACP methyl ester carboxylesterase